MRFDTPVYFQKIRQGTYDTSTGNYGPDEVTETRIYADVTDTGTETMHIIYGGIRQGSKVIRLQNHYNSPFDRIRIGRRVYQTDYSRKLRTKHVFVVSGVQ